MKVEPVPPTAPTDHNPGEACEGQAYADRLRAVIAAGPLSAPLDTRTNKKRPAETPHQFPFDSGQETPEEDNTHLQAKQEPDTG